MGRLQLDMEILQGTCQSCHVPCCSTPALLCSRTHRTVPVQMWMDETKSSFEMAKAKIDGRDISYPYLLDAKGEPRLQCTNAFMIWYCERCDTVTKKSVVEKAESWLMACGNLCRVKFDPSGPGLTKGIFTQAMLVKVAIKGHQEAYSLHSIASGKEVAARADNLLSYAEMQDSSMVRDAPHTNSLSQWEFPHFRSVIRLASPSVGALRPRTAVPIQHPI